MSLAPTGGRVSPLSSLSCSQSHRGYDWLERLLRLYCFSDSDDLCNVRYEIEKKYLGEGESLLYKAGSGFSAMVVVKCAYRFVWYQLAHEYFTVGRTPNDDPVMKTYTLTTASGDKYNANCGQIFLFP